MPSLLDDRSVSTLEGRPGRSFTATKLQASTFDPKVTLLARDLRSPEDSYPSSMYLDPALRQVEEVVNIEVDEAHIGNETNAKSSYGLVLDTNVLLGYLEVLEQFVCDCDSCGAPVEIIVPGVVVQELDSQKSGRSEFLMWSARMASTWILNQLKRKKIVKGQAYAETLQASGTWKIRDVKDLSNDDLIIDCCLYFRKRHHRTFIVSADNNLCNNALAQDIPIINPRDARKWSSRALARDAFGDRPEIEQIALCFGGPSDTRQSQRQREALERDLGVQRRPRHVEAVVDGMDVDDGFDIEPSREHLLDNLHRQIITHFSSLIEDLVSRVRSHHKIDYNNISRYSPLAKLIRPPGEPWKTADHIRLLSATSSGIFPRSATRGDQETISAGSTRLASFLADPYEERGRKGQEWTRADWYCCLGVLECLGRVWSDESILLSMTMLRPQVDVDFMQPMRPT